MSIRSLAARALCACTLVLALGCGVAGATVTLGLTPGEDTLASVGNVSFTAGELAVTCAVSLTGSFHEAIVQRSGEAIASVTRATTSRCEGGERPSVTVLGTPWTLAYSSFTGTEPERLTAIAGSIAATAVDVAAGRLSCLYRGELGLSFALEGIDPDEVGVISTLTNSLTLVSGAGCARSATIRGSFRLTRAEWLSVEEMPGGMMAADPSRLSALVAGSGAQVTFTNDTGAAITVTSTNFAGATGWTVNNQCTTVMNMRTCVVTLTAGAGATAGQFQLLAGATVVGRVFLVPQ